MYSVFMDMMGYLLKRTINYILSVLAMMAVYGIFTIGFNLRLGELVHSIAFSIMLFAYPFYRIIRSTVTVIVDYYENDEVHAELVMKKFIPGFLFGNKKRIFRLNMYSKFIQIFIIGSMIYAFAMNDYNILKMAIAVICIIFMALMYILIKYPAVEYVNKRRQEDIQLMKKQVKTGFPPEQKKLKSFMKLPSSVLGANIIMVIIAFLLIILNPAPNNLLIYYFLMVIKTICGISLLFLPGSALFYSAEKARSRNYTIEIGKGEYGQVKVEFYKFEGYGDDRKEIRNKIDRIQVMDLGSRYIYILRMSQFKYIKIPRTFKNEELMLETMRIMM
ncbi:MAG: hypothetical protein HFE90_10730 [Firmicutes bacterium]|nr:hypothetical protein [Bacillota bacterium]